MATVAAVARKTVISYPSRNCCSVQERRESGNKQAQVMAKRREDLKATPNLPLSVIAIALPAPDRAKANTRVGTSAPHAAGNDTDSGQTNRYWWVTPLQRIATPKTLSERPAEGMKRERPCVWEVSMDDSTAVDISDDSRSVNRAL